MEENYHDEVTKPIEAFHHKCQRCEYEWNSFEPKPKCCPRCKSPIWFKEKK